jgi:sphingolipid delta-4 desaturase
MNAKNTPYDPGFITVDFPQPHPGVTRQLLARHPEIRQLIGHNPWSFVAIVGLVSLQTAVAAALSLTGSPWWLYLIAAYTVGALADHGLWVMIHEATHNLVFAKRRPNQVAGLIANLPLLVPGHFSFQLYHLRHHAYQGEYDHDADLASYLEAKIIGNETLKKALWLLLFPVVQGLRPLHLHPKAFLDRRVLTNWTTQLVYILLVGFLAGPAALGYLLISLFFSIGLHPVGARWIQEHYTLSADQETFSYYGPANIVAFNVGYHNEHHDFPSVPWNRLPQITRIANEHYGALQSHRSWTALLFQFLLDPRYSLFSRVVRESGRRPARLDPTDLAPPASV